MRIKLERIRKRMTQKELALKSGVSRYLISKAEHGDYSKLTYEKMSKLSEVLGVGVKDLFFGK